MTSLIAALLIAVFADLAYTAAGDAFGPCLERETGAPVRDCLELEPALRRDLPVQPATNSASAELEAQIRRALEYAPGTTCELKFYKTGTVTVCE